MHRIFVRSAVFLSVVGGLGAAAAGCLTRPVGTGSPTTKVNFTAAVKQQAVDKVDILFMIDNSASMGDKTEYLRVAIPDLLTRLLTPNCVDATGATVGVSDLKAYPANDGCRADSTIEFPAVRNLHIGVVTSSLGKRGGDLCDPNATINGRNRHNDDKGHLINRGGSDEHPIANMGTSNFLTWFPTVAANAGKDAGTPTPYTDPVKLQADFQDLIAGVNQYGCGIESQLESFYRFLIQPDPYAEITVTGGRADWVGVDVDLLKQRKDFLRPDSLVAIIDLSDENDAEIDVRSFGGQAYHWMIRNEPQLPRGTRICDTNPNDPGCTYCPVSGDPNCALGNYPVDNANWGFNANLRRAHMKQKYGVDLQYPIDRYRIGLTEPKVPNRDGEHSGGSDYLGLDPNNWSCTNPLFAKELPDGSDLTKLCALTLGTRTKELVFYAHIGGVPWQLLVVDPNAARSAIKLKPQPLADADWIPILGTDPVRYDFTGIDPHMLEDYQPRRGLSLSLTSTNSIHGREWLTTGSSGGLDLEFACTFDLVNLSISSSPPLERDCNVAANTEICDCPTLTEVAKLKPEQVPPVCKGTSGVDATIQVKGKTYPTIRELHLAKLLGKQGIVSSLCPINTRPESATDPLFGYRPAVATIIDRLKNALANQCLPRKLAIENKRVSCLILERLAEKTGACTADAGLKQPDADVLRVFREQQHVAWVAAGGAKSGLEDPSLFPVCEVFQLDANVDCRNLGAPGWCYVEGASAGTCGQAILFSKGGNPPSGAEISLQCIQETGGDTSVDAAAPAIDASSTDSSSGGG